MAPLRVVVASTAARWGHKEAASPRGEQSRQRRSEIGATMVKKLFGSCRRTEVLEMTGVGDDWA